MHVVCICMNVYVCATSFAMGVEGSEDDVAIHGGDLDNRSGDRFQSQVRHCDFLREREKNMLYIMCE